MTKYTLQSRVKTAHWQYFILNNNFYFMYILLVTFLVYLSIFRILLKFVNYIIVNNWIVLSVSCSLNFQNSIWNLNNTLLIGGLMQRPFYLFSFFYFNDLLLSKRPEVKTFMWNSAKLQRVKLYPLWQLLNFRIICLIL